VLIARQAQRGVTLIELMIGLAILAMLIGLGFPAMSTFLANGKVRNATENLSAGLSLARSEAMRRNRNVEFVLTNDAVSAATVGTVTASTSGRHWLVRVLNPATANYELIEARSGFEGSGQSEAGAPTVVLAASNAQITFRGLGGTQGLAAAATFNFSNPSAGACHTVGTPGPIRCLRVIVSVAGQVRSCDPGTAAPDTRAC
jgi:type IV fimbrial biogenesis protein FimT